MKLTHLFQKKTEDPSQRRAGTRILVFFVGMLLLTLLAKGIAGTTTARVHLTNSSAHTIVHEFTVEGFIEEGSQLTVLVPAGYIVSECCVEIGSQVSPGDVLLRFDQQDIQNKTDRKRAELGEQQARLNALNAGQNVSYLGVEQAQLEVNRANEALNQANAELTAAKNALQQAESALTAAQQAQTEAQTAYDQAAEENRPEALNKLETAKQAATEAATAYNNAKTRLQTAEAAQVSAKQQAENAAFSLRQAQTSYYEAAQQAAQTKESNQAQAQSLILDMEETQKIIDGLESFLADGACFRAETGGTITEFGTKVGQTSTGAEQISLRPDDAALRFSFVIPQAQAKAFAGAKDVTLEQMGLETRIDPKELQLDPQPDGSVRCSGVLSLLRMQQGGVTVRCLLSSATYQTCIPLSALHTDAAGSFLFIYSPKTSVLGVQDSAVRMDVLVLDMDGEYAAVQSSLTVKDQIIESSSKPLQNGDRVRAEP